WYNRLFFFSSRRRHTRWPRDWSSDVCSSDLVCHQRHSAHFAPLSQKANLRGWIQTHVSDGEIDQLLNTRSRVVKYAQQDRISSTLWRAEIWPRQDLRQLFFGKVTDGWASVSPQRDREDFLTLMHTGRLFRLNI